MVILLQREHCKTEIITEKSNAADGRCEVTSAGRQDQWIHFRKSTQCDTMQSDSQDGDNEQRTYTYSPALEKL